MARIVEQIFKSAWSKLPPQTKQQIIKGIRSGSPQAAKTINSIFKISLNDAKKYLAAAGVSLGTIGAAQASTNKSNKKIDPVKDKIIAAAKEAYKITDPLGHITDAALIMLPEIGIGRVTGKIAKPALQQINKARIAAVKANPKVAKIIENSVRDLRAGVDNFIAKAAGKNYRVATSKEIENLGSKGYSEATLDDLKGLGFTDDQAKSINKIANSAKDGSLTKTEDTEFLKLIKENAVQLQSLAKNAGVKTKGELAGFLKFIKDTTKLIENSPKHIKALAVGGSVAGGLSGLTIYDLYQSYKQNGDSFAGLKTPMGKILRHVLGYDGKDKLSKTAARQAGLNDQLSTKQSQDADLGLFSQDIIDSEVPEFFTGGSGRKYHNLNGYIYDFATGKPVNIANAINDYTQALSYEDQQIIDKTNTINSQIADLQSLQQRGYGVPQEQLMQLQYQADALDIQSKNVKKQLAAISEPDYNNDSPLVDQYKTNVVDPQQQAMTGAAANTQSQDQLNQIAYDEMYKKGFEQIAQNYYNQIENYYTPEVANVDYHKYYIAFTRGEVPYMDAQQFYNYKKMSMMHEIAPQIQQQAMQFASNYANTQSQTVGNYYKGVDIQRKRDKDIADINQAYLNYEEDKRHNRVSENISFGEYLVKQGQLNVNQANAETNRMNAVTNRGKLGIDQTNAETSRMNAITNQGRLKLYEQESPYKQFANMGQGFSGGAMGNVDADTMINLNPEIGKRVAPQAFVQQQPTPQAQQSNQPSLIDKALGLFRGN